MGDLAHAAREPGRKLRRYRDQLADDTAPTWTRSSLGLCPDDPEHAALWRATVADAAAYRSVHHILDEGTLAGARPNDRRAGMDWIQVKRRAANLFEQRERQQHGAGHAPENQPEIARIEQRTRRI